MSAVPKTEANPHEEPIERMGAKLLQALVDELRTASKNWQQLSKEQQDRVIDRLRFKVRTETEVAMNAIASGTFEAASVKVDQITVKDGAKCVISIATNLHEAVDRVGRPAVLVMCDPSQYFAGMDEIEGEADQKPLELPDTSGFNGERHDPPGGDADGEEA